MVQHVDYFDRDHDGVIWPRDTYAGLRAWGWSVLLSLYAVLLIHGALSYPTAPTPLPDPFFRIFTRRLHKAKHGGDSMSYDNEGRFRPQNFEDFFAKYDRDAKGGLSVPELFAAWRGQALVLDVFGSTAAFFECEALFFFFFSFSSTRLIARGVFRSGRDG